MQPGMQEPEPPELLEVRAVEAPSELSWPRAGHIGDLVPELRFRGRSPGQQDLEFAPARELPNGRVMFAARVNIARAESTDVLPLRRFFVGGGGGEEAVVHATGEVVTVTPARQLRTASYQQLRELLGPDTLWVETLVVIRTDYTVRPGDTWLAEHFVSFFEEAEAWLRKELPDYQLMPNGILVPRR